MYNLDSKKIAERVEQLMKENYDLKDAMFQAVEEQKEEQRKQETITDRVAWISSLSDVAQLRNAIKIAFAKKSKSKGDDLRVAKYEKEIKAGQKRLNELLGQVNKSKDIPRWEAALQSGETVTGVVHMFIEDVESEMKEQLEEQMEQRKVSKNKLKEMLASISSETPAHIISDLSKTKEVLEAYKKRETNGDQRVVTLNKKLNLLSQWEVK